MKKRMLLALTLLPWTTSEFAADLAVSGDRTTIQTTINPALPGDTINVSNGEY